MSEPLPGPSHDALRPIRDADPGAGSARPPSLEQAAAFRALLEDLERKAALLEERSRSSELSPLDLQGAVEEARTTMEGALSLQAQLLEAWRAERQRRA
jgi:hypothetical protein